MSLASSQCAENIFLIYLDVAYGAGCATLKPSAKPTVNQDGGMVEMRHVKSVRNYIAYKQRIIRQRLNLEYLL